MKQSTIGSPYRIITARREYRPQLLFLARPLQQGAARGGAAPPGPAHITAVHPGASVSDQMRETGQADSHRAQQTPPGVSRTAAAAVVAATTRRASAQILRQLALHPPCGGCVSVSCWLPRGATHAAASTNVGRDLTLAADGGRDPAQPVERPKTA